MTVEQLIKLLEKQPDDEEVVVRGNGLLINVGRVERQQTITTEFAVNGKAVTNEDIVVILN